MPWMGRLENDCHRLDANLAAVGGLVGGLRCLARLPSEQAAIQLGAALPEKWALEILWADFGVQFGPKQGLLRYLFRNFSMDRRSEMQSFAARSSKSDGGSSLNQISPSSRYS